MNKPKVSIVVPVYNVEPYLKQCLDSLINQTYVNLEIWLIDDGSTDKSAVICDAYAKLNEKITVIHKENGGLSSARNVGLDYCTGELILLVAAQVLSMRKVNVFIEMSIRQKCLL